MRRRSHERLGIDDHPEILDNLRGNEVGLLRVDHNTQLPTEVQDNLEIQEKRLPRRGLDEPVVEVATHADTPRVEDGRNRSHDPE